MYNNDVQLADFVESEFLGEQVILCSHTTLFRMKLDGTILFTSNTYSSTA